MSNVASSLDVEGKGEAVKDEERGGLLQRRS